MTFALDCCDREAISWAATTAGHSGDVVRDVMLAAVERHFGAALKASTTIEWLTDNGSGYIAERTRSFALELGLKPLTTPVCSPQSNGMAESFVKTMKRDYIAFMPKPDEYGSLQPGLGHRALQRKASTRRIEVPFPQRVPASRRFINQR